MEDPETVDRLAAAVRAGSKYQNIDPGLIRRICRQELRSRRFYKEALKAARSQLHQVAAAYQESGIDYNRWLAELDQPHNLKEVCRSAMRQHASTRERLPYLEEFFHRTLPGLGPFNSVLDLACGLNPLAIPWMPLAEGAHYYACDIYNDLVDFLNVFFTHVSCRGEAFTQDLVENVPDQVVELAFLLKTIPCLEQLDHSIGKRLLKNIRAKYVLVSFPARSLGGRFKGMPKNYEAHFQELVSDLDWKVQRFEFPTELVFLLAR